MDLASLCCGRTRGALLAKPPAGARLHYHRDRSAARVCVDHDHRVQTLWPTPPLACRPVGYRPTALGAHRAVWTWRRCVVAERVACSSPSRWLGLDCTNIAAGWRHGLSKFAVTAFSSDGARPARSPPREASADRPRSTCRAVHTWRGCVVAQREARSSPSRWLWLDCSNTAGNWRHGFPSNVFEHRVWLS